MSEGRAEVIGLEPFLSPYPAQQAVPTSDNTRNEATAAEAPTMKKLAMERKELDKKRHRQLDESAKPQLLAAEAATPANSPPAPAAVGPGLHMNVFKDLASPEASVREAATQALVAELWQV